MCEAHNYKVKEGMTDRQWMKIARIMGLKIRSCLKEEMSLGDFILKYSKGCYFVGQKDHLFVVDDGIIYDPRTIELPGLRRLLVQAWKVAPNK